jgi:hypothetical protein
MIIMDFLPIDKESLKVKLVDALVEILGILITLCYIGYIKELLKYGGSMPSFPT